MYLIKAVLGQWSEPQAELLSEGENAGDEDSVDEGMTSQSEFIMTMTKILNAEKTFEAEQAVEENEMNEVEGDAFDKDGVRRWKLSADEECEENDLDE